MAQNDTATIEGTTTENTTGPYGETGCDETMHVVFDGEDVFVPFNSVRASGYDYHGEVPDEFDVDRIINYDGHVHAEADVKGGGSLRLSPTTTTPPASSVDTTGGNYRSSRARRRRWARSSTNGTNSDRPLP